MAKLLANYKSKDETTFFNKSLCRICQVQQEESLNCFRVVNKNEEVFLHEVYSYVTGLQISELDGLPNAICFLCADRLNNAYYLKKQALVSFKSLSLLKISRPTDKSENEENFINSSKHISVSKNKHQEFEVHLDNDSKALQLDNASNAVEFLTNHNLIINLTNIKERCVFSHSDKRHECNHCHKKFLRKSNLVDHLRLHANVKLFKCEFCSKSFVQIGNYKSHLRIHTNERPFACYICSKSYNQSSALKIHIRSHTNERNYICDCCSKAFTNASDLSKHKIVHDPSKYVKCEFCNRSFAQKSNLRNHIKKNHLDDL